MSSPARWGGTTYFTISIDPATGVVTFTQVANIWHSDPTNPRCGDADARAGLLQLVQTVTDADGDSATASINLGAGVFTIQDDGPTFATLSITSGTLIEDETPGVDGFERRGAERGAGCSVRKRDTTKAAIRTSPDPASGDKVVGYAQTTFSFNASVDYGTDGQGATGAQYGLAISANNLLSGLADTPEGDNVFLLNEGGIIVGRVDGNHDRRGGRLMSEAVFAIRINSSTGQLTVVQYLSIKQNDANNSNDATFLASGTVSMTVTFTDGDGDTTGKSTDISNRIIFLDDGPTVSIADTPTDVNEGATISGTWTMSEGVDGLFDRVTGSVEVTVGRNHSQSHRARWRAGGRITDQLLKASRLPAVRSLSSTTAPGALQSGSVSSDQTFSFTIKTTDGDGDPASDLQTITVHNTSTPLVQTAGFAGLVEEEQLNSAAAHGIDDITSVTDLNAGHDMDCSAI